MLQNLTHRKSKYLGKRLILVLCCMFLLSHFVLKSEWKDSSQVQQEGMGSIFGEADKNHEWWCQEPAPQVLGNYKMGKINDSKRYQGDVVEGWPPNRSRNVRDYIDLDNHILMDFDKEACHASKSESNRFTKNIPIQDWKKKNRVLIMQHSAVTNFDDRQENRETWMQSLKEYPHIRAIFVVGRPAKNEVEVNKKLAKEQTTYCDILQVDYIEHYNNNTFKSVHALNYLYRKKDWDESNGPPDYIFRTDDDVYVNIASLHDLLFRWPSGMNTYRSKEVFRQSCKERKPAMYGLLISGARPFHEKTNETTDKETKWLVPKYMYNDEHYPTYLHGAGYIIPRWAIACLATQILDIPYFFIEDVHTTGIVALKCKIPRRSSRLRGVEMFRDLPTTNLTSLKQDIIFYHYMRGSMKYQVHKKILLLNQKAYNKDDGTILEVPGFDGHRYKVVGGWKDVAKYLHLA